MFVIMSGMFLIMSGSKYSIMSSKQKFMFPRMNAGKKFDEMVLKPQL